MLGPRCRGRGWRVAGTRRRCRKDQRTGIDFSDPTKIHGMEMPGVRELEAGAGRVDVRYQELSTGAEITYSSTEPNLVDALHAWFDRQTSDHSMPGMGG